MPYIPKEEDALVEFENCKTPGQLHAKIALLIKTYMKHNIKNYETLAKISGVLIQAHTEFYHRIVRPYEDNKRMDRGNIDPYEGI